MAEVPVDKRFRGSIRLVTLLLWRIAKSTNVEDGFRAARELKMFDELQACAIRLNSADPA